MSAQRTGREEETLRECQLVVFSLAGETYGVDIGGVREIIIMQKIVPVPRAPDYIEGIINLRGKVIPVIDLKKHFGLKDSRPGHHIILVNSGEDYTGVIVDAVSSVTRVPESSIEPTLPTIVGAESEYVRGAAKTEDGLIVLLDLTKIISQAERRALQPLAVG